MTTPVQKPALAAPVTEEPAHTDEAETFPCGWMSHDFEAETPINRNEMTSLTALIAYVAHTSRQHEHRVERMFADRFNIPNLSCLPSARYDDAIRYLVDQVPAETPPAT